MSGGQSTSERKAELTKLRSRLKFAVGAYHTLLDEAAFPYSDIDGMPGPRLKEWADELIDGIRDADIHGHVMLVNLCCTASEDNRSVVNKGKAAEAVIYEPNIALYVDTYGFKPEQVVKALNAAVDGAVRAWLTERGGEDE
jgi:hypothetical protein